MSLLATLDWSYEVLNDNERVAFRRLAVFRGSFSMDSAVAVISDDMLSAADVMDDLISLVDKSLIAADISQQVTRFRLPHVTRAYALRRMAESEDEHLLRRRHAAHFQELLQSAHSDWEITSHQQWLGTYGETIDDVRVALEWAFSCKGDLRIGAALTAAALPFGASFAASVSLAEFKRWAQLALEAIAQLEPRQKLIELRVEVALYTLNYLIGDTKILAAHSSNRARDLAMEIGLARYKIEPLQKCAIEQVDMADYSAAVNTTNELVQEARATDDPMAMLVADRVRAQVYHYAGNHDEARKVAERVLRHPAAAIPLVYAQMGIDRQISMRVMLARILWLQGHYDRAQELNDEALTLAAQAGPYALVQALALSGCQLAFWSGDILLASQRVDRLVSLTRQNGQLSLYTLARSFHVAVSELSKQSHHAEVGDPPMLVRPAGRRQREELSTVCDYWLDAETIAAAERSPHGWCAAEVLRAAGELALRHRLPDCHTVAEARFRRSLAIAAAQGAVTWELRAAISLGRLLKVQGRNSEATDLVRPLLARIVTTRTIGDVTEARLLVSSLQPEQDGRRFGRLAVVKNR